MENSIASNLKNNWKSGLTIGLVSIPIAVSLAVASHASPTAGLITAFWAGLVASFFGGSNYNIIGPTGSLAGLLFMYTLIFGPTCLPMLAILSGLFILVAYIFKIERYLIFVPGCALHGLVLGIACIIMLNQIAPALGIAAHGNQHNLFIKAYNTLQNINAIAWPSFLFFCIILATLFLLSRYVKRVPGTIIIAPLGIACGYACSNNLLPFHLETLGSKYHNISATLFMMPHYHFSFTYIIPALSIATVAILETLVSAKIADGITKTKHNKRKEVLGLGIANIICGIAGGFPATAALARTSLNIRSGATHTTSATISSLCVALIALLCFGYFTYLPLACVASILVFVAIRMIEVEHFVRMFTVDKKSFIIAVIVAVVTICQDASIGVLLGSVIAMLIFMEKLSQGHHQIHHPLAPPQNDTLVYAIKGPLAYINSHAHITGLETTQIQQKNVVLDMHNVHLIDLDGVEAFGEMVTLLEQKGHIVHTAGINKEVEHFLNENHIFKTLKKEQRVQKD